MIVYVHSDDIYDRGRAFGRHTALRDVQHVIIPARTPVADIASRVIAAVRHERSIWLLILNGHGWAARIMIGEGIDAWNLFDLAPLRPYMTPGGRGVEIHACHVASAESVDGRVTFQEVGIEFMTRLAHVLNADVRASTRLQVGVEENWFGPVRGSDLVGVFEGDMLLVRADGSGSSHMAGY